MTDERTDDFAAGSASAVIPAVIPAVTSAVTPADTSNAVANAVANAAANAAANANYGAEVAWRRGEAEAFTDQRYSRRHRLRFDGGAELAGSSSPHSVPLPYSDPSAVDPEELFVAALASCHMLWFLSLAAARGHVVQRYDDDAVGVLAPNAAGRMAMTVVTLRPQVVFAAGRSPDAAALRALHHSAHARCYIANSVTTDVRCEPRLRDVDANADMNTDINADMNADANADAHDDATARANAGA